MFGRTSPENDWEFEAEGQTEAVNRLLYVVESGEILSLVEGAAGTGKSTVLRRTADELAAQGRRAILQNVAALDCRATLWHLCGALSVVADADAGSSVLMMLVRDELLARARCEHQTVLLLDDTDLAQKDVKIALNLLASIAEASEGVVSVIVAATESLTFSMQKRSSLRICLQPLSEREAIEFAVRRLTHLNCDVSQIDDTGWRALADLGRGLPAQLLRICQMLQVVMSVQPGTVDAALVHAAAQELLPQAA